VTGVLLALLGLSVVSLGFAGYVAVGRAKWELYKRWLYVYSAIVTFAVLLASLLRFS